MSAQRNPAGDPQEEGTPRGGEPARRKVPKRKTRRPPQSLPDWFVELGVENRLSDMLDSALSSREINAGVASAGLNEDFLKTEALADASTITADAEEPALALWNAQRVDNSFQEWRVLWSKRIARSSVAIGVLLPLGYVFLALRREWASPLWGLRWYWQLGVVVVAGLVIFLLLRLGAVALFEKLRFWPVRLSLMSQEQNAESRFQDALAASVGRWLRERINTTQPRSYDTVFRVESSPQGLAEIADPRYEIPTAAKEQIEQLTGSMVGGAIGISGPRGVGKSTVIRSFCGPRPIGRGTGEIGNGSRILRVMVSAPVHYEAREFVLHLFATLCQTILRTKQTADPWAYSPDPDFDPTRMSKLSLFRAGAVLSLLAIAGGVVTSVIAILDLQISSVLAWGLMVQAIGVVGLLWFYRLFRMHVYPFRLRRYNQPDPSARAAQWLERIRFQQTYSQGWSGSLKLPVAVEGGVEASRSFARLQLTYPEIVDGLRDFIREITATTPPASDDASWERCYIGIDELDKIESDEDAKLFINDIKGLFGLERCFYFVSVSENAMSSFERRGLPFRDVFDSSFDEIVLLDYLDLASSRRLIQRRVIGMSEPFICLCHCLSGGLPRDLIRVARTLMALPRDDHSALPLPEITHRLVSREFQAKLEALCTEAKRVSLDPQIGRFLIAMEELKTKPVSTATLLECCESMLSTLGTRLHPKNAEATRQYGALGLEVSGFAYYSATICEFFGASLNEAQLKNSVDRGKAAGGIDQLAYSRQAFAIDWGVAWKAISDFRRAHEMEPLSGRL
jgi:hypothetical protein